VSCSRAPRRRATAAAPRRCPSRSVPPTGAPRRTAAPGRGRAACAEAGSSRRRGGRRVACHSAEVTAPSRRMRFACETSTLWRRSRRVPPPASRRKAAPCSRVRFACVPTIATGPPRRRGGWRHCPVVSIDASSVDPDAIRPFAQRAELGCGPDSHAAVAAFLMYSCSRENLYACTAYSG